MHVEFQVVLSTLKMSFHCLRTFIVSDSQSLLLVFRHLITICLDVVCLSMCFFPAWFIKIVGSLGLEFSPNLKKKISLFFFLFFAKVYLSVYNNRQSVSHHRFHFQLLGMFISLAKRRD